MAFAIFSNSVSDVPTLTGKYFPMVGPTLGKYGGILIGLDEAHDVVEGKSKFKRSAVVWFPSTENAKAWYNSDEYQKAKPIRIGVTTEPGFGVVIKAASVEKPPFDFLAFGIWHFSITDEKSFNEKYASKAGGLAGKGGITSLAYGTFENLENKSTYTTCSLIGLRSKAAFKNWYNSPEYQKILPERLNATEKGGIGILCSAAETPVLYKMDASANNVGSMAFNRYSGLEWEEKTVNLMAGEQHKPEFLKINPFHTVPALKINSESSLWESSVILRYMAGKAMKGYPSDDFLASKVDVALDYRQGTLYPKVSKACYHYLGFAPSPSAGEIKANNEALETEVKRFGDIFLKEGKFANGLSEPTIADFNLVGALEFVKVVPNLKWPKAVTEYMARFEKAVPQWASAAAVCKGYVASKKA